MKIRVLFSLLFAAFFSNAVLAGFEQPSGERFIAFEPDPEQWEIHNKDLINSKGLVWYNKEMRTKGRAFDDFYMINVYNRSDDKEGLAHVRDWVDIRGRRDCSAYESEELQRNLESKYDAIFWKTTCLHAKRAPSRIINLVLGGERHIYLFQKGWRGDVEQADINTWIERIGEIYLCNDNSTDSPCPSVEPAADQQTGTQESESTEPQS
jgi:hypothetical protein